MIQLIKANGLTYGAGAIQIINKYGKPKTAGAGGTVWGTITGTITDQTDLISYLSGNYYPLSSNPAGYLTSITSSDVTTALGYTPYSDTNPSGFITSAALTPYLTSASAALTYYPLSNPSGYINGITSSDVTTALGFTPYSNTNPAGYIDSSALAPYLTSASAALTYYPLTNPNGYITSSALTPYLTSATAAATYQPIGSYLTTISGLNISLLNNDTGYITSAALSGYLTSATAASTYFPIPTGTTSEYLRGDGSVATFPTIPSVTPSALTKTDDTNVTLTLGGSPSNALLAGVSLTLGWTGTLADSRIASASTWNAKQDALSGTGFVVSTGGVISYDTNTYYLASNPAGYIDSSALSSYVPYTGGTSDVDLGAYNMTAAKFIVPGGTPNDFLKADGSLDSTVYYNASNPAGYITSSALSGYVDLTNAQTIAGQKTFTNNTNIGNASGTNQRQLRVGQGTAIIDIGNVAAYPGMAVIHLNTATPSANNYALMHDGSSTYLNSINSNPLYLCFNNNIQQTLASGFITFSPITRTSGSITPFTFTVPPNTNQTLSVNTPNFKIVGNSKQFATGALAAQYFNYFSGNTLAFVGASTATDVFNAFFEITTAGTNATITNNYALGTNGNVKFDDGTSKFIWRAVPTVPSYSGIFLNVSPNSSNYALVNDGSGNTFLNGTSSVYVSANATNVARFGTVFQLHTPIAATSGSIIKWQLTVPADTGMTASTNIPNFKITGNTKQFATGALATQYFNYITANTLAFVGASTATDVFNLFVEKPIAGTNATITNNYAIGTDGNIKAGGNITATSHVTSGGTASQFVKGNGSLDSTSYGYLLAHDYSDGILTGSTTSTQVKSIPVSAATFSAGSIFKLLGGFDKTGIAGALTVRIYVNTVNNLTGTPILIMLSSYAAANVTGTLDRTVVVRTGSTWSYTGSVANNMLNVSTSTVVSSDVVIDWSVQQYIILALQLGNAADSVNFKSFGIGKY